MRTERRPPQPPRSGTWQHSLSRQGRVRWLSLDLRQHASPSPYSPISLHNLDDQRSSYLPTAFRWVFSLTD